MDPKDIEAKKYPIRIKVTSDGDGDKIDEVTINPTVKEKYLIKLEADIE